MAEALLKFAVTPRETPHKRGAEERAHDFSEIYAGFTPPEAGTQSSRCSQCGVPFCQSKCPLGNDIPDWLRLTAEGRWREAYELSQATSTLPEVCGRICPQDRLCEGACVVEQAGFGTVTIGAVEAHLSDLAWREGWVAPLRPLRELGLSVGIVGSGPAGLSAADRLRAEGYAVTVYDRHDRAGGLLTYGIPGFKLDKEIVDRRVRRLAEGGVEFRLECDIGRDLAWADLRARHDAVLVATGVYAARALAAPGGPINSGLRSFQLNTKSAPRLYHVTATAPVGYCSAPYLTLLVISSCTISPTLTTCSAGSSTAGPVAVSWGTGPWV